MKGFVLGALLLLFVSGCARTWPGAGDGGLTPDGIDLEDSVGDGDGAASNLRVVPALVEDLWVEQGTTRSYAVALVETGGGSLPALKASSSAPWVTATLAGSTALKLVVDAGSLSPGSYGEKVMVAPRSANSGLSPVTIELRIRVLALEQVHVGLSADSCPHKDASGASVTACDHSGADGLKQAAAAWPAGGVHIHLHDDGSKTAAYDGDVSLPGLTWLSAAEGGDPRRVHVVWPGGHGFGVLRLSGDDIHVSRLTVLCRSGCDHGIAAWHKADGSTGASSGHLIENVVVRALSPEIMGNNGIKAPVQLGSDTTLRNCRFEGFLELEIKLDGVRRTRLVQNTYVAYQVWHGGISVRGSRDVVIANNVFVNNTVVVDQLIEADALTTRLTLAGNVVEGAARLASGLSGTSHTVQDNVVGEAQLESPSRPLFLAGATQRASDRVPFEGLSLDGVAPLHGTARLPGALQQRSAATKRRMLARVGRGSCGGHPCDVDATADNEVQQAVWSVWRGGTVEVYPSAQPYAGNAVIGWPLTLRGMGAQPGQVVLRSEEELPAPQLWRHGAVLVALKRIDAAVTVENLTVEVVTAADAGRRAVAFDSDADTGRQADHVLRRLRVVSSGSGTGLDEGLLLGHGTLVQDVLVHGDFEACIRFGPRPYGSRSTPETTGRVVNLTCRLTGSGNHAPRAAFEVASVKGTLLTNVAVDLATAAPLFRAQRRSEGDTGAKALDIPAGFTLHAAAVRGVGQTFDGFTAADGSYKLVSVDTVLAADPFFVSATDSHLAGGAKAIDTGVDPATLDSSLKAGVSIDGVSRQGRKIDRGAFEQGS